METVQKIFEKANKCMGKDNWQTVDFSNGNIVMADGPHGVRKEIKNGKKNEALSESCIATCFPPAVMAASTFNKSLIEEMGKAIGQEAAEKGVDIILGPAINIKRTPLCGRNFEYPSEDPYINAQYAISYIKGLQSTGVGACLKHFACTNQESYRMSVNAVIDEKTLREIYLYPFEKCIRECSPRAIMTSYNKINGEYVSENQHLIRDILRKEYGFNGIVLSDWAGISNRVASIKAGCNLEMPNSGSERTKELTNAVLNNFLSENVIDESIKYIEKNIYPKPSIPHYQLSEHHKLAKSIADEGIVLLSNDGILPLNSYDNIAVIGEFAKYPHYQGGGSSHINTNSLSIPYNELIKAGYNCEYEKGYRLSNKKPNKLLIKKATKLAAKSKTVLLFIGLTDSDEFEGTDRYSTDISLAQKKLIDAVTKVNDNIIAIICGGSAINMPWAHKFRAIIYTSVFGEAGAEALCDIIKGKVNPSGRLTETFPGKINPFVSNSILGDNKNVFYTEGKFIGYRYYDFSEKEVQFPFGHGLSYTTFVYSNLNIIHKDDCYYAEFNLKNNGDRDGSEAVLLFVGRKAPEECIRQLMAFDKYFIPAGETMHISIKIDNDAFRSYIPSIGFKTINGLYNIEIMRSTKDLRLISIIDYNDGTDITDTIDNEKDILSNNSLHNDNEITEYTTESLVKDIRKKWFGRRLYGIAKMAIKITKKGKENKIEMKKLIEGLDYLPLRALTGYSGGYLNYYAAKQFADVLNKKISILKAISNISKDKKNEKRNTIKY